MRKFLIPLLIALMLPVFAHAQEGNKTRVTLSGSFGARVQFQAMIERPLIYYGPFSLNVGGELRVGKETTIAPFVIVNYWADDFGIWAEFHAPQLFIPTIGSPDVFRIGFTFTIP
jgi:hypothetical protein